jgi:hypothetical protein
VNHVHFETEKRLGLRRVAWQRPQNVVVETAAARLHGAAGSNRGPRSTSKRAPCWLSPNAKIQMYSHELSGYDSGESWNVDRSNSSTTPMEVKMLKIIVASVAALAVLAFSIYRVRRIAHDPLPVSRNVVQGTGLFPLEKIH